MDNKNKRIAKNTLLLYIRMIVMTLIMFYSSRITLKVLGVEDFGIYNVVAGVVVLFSFLNNTMIGSIQRFLNFLLGKGDLAGVKKVFVQSKIVSYIFAVVFLFLSETIGLYYVAMHLNVPDGRLFAAGVVYQLSILGAIFTILRIPYQACVISYERMNAFAIISIVDAILKLIIVWILYAIAYDRLIMYSVLFCVVTLLTTVSYIVYCYTRINIVTHKLFVDKSSLRGLMSFTGWNLMGSCSSVLSTQGISIILNFFFGVIANAAMGIANQVLAGIYNLAASFTNAFNPVLVKSYAEGDKTYYISMLTKSSRLTFDLMWIICLPIIIWCEELLCFWLGTVPPYAVSFCRIMIVYSLIEGISAPLWMLAHAEGNIRKYQLVISVLTISSLLIGFVFLLIFNSPTYMLGSRLFISLIIYVYRITYIANRFSIKFSVFFNDFISRVCLIIFISTVILYILQLYIQNSIWGFFASVAISFIIVLFWGLNMNEKNQIKEKIISSISQ